MIMVRIVKGCQVPLRDPSGGVKFAVEITEGEIRRYNEYLEWLERFLAEGVQYAEDLSRSELLELVADLIALYFKAPLMIDPIFGLIRSPFKIYFIWRILEKKFKEESRKPLEQFLDKDLEVLLQSGLNDVLEIFDRESRDAEIVISKIPADTRPGYNCSSLIVHLLAVSSLAWSIGVQKGLSRKDLAVLRIAALLHDIAKPLKPREHAKESASLAEWLLRRALKGRADEDLSRIVDVIKRHHERDHDMLVEVLKEADRLAAATDRVNSIVKSLVIPEIAKSLGMSEEEAFSIMYVKGGQETWDRWEKLSDRILDLTERCAKELATTPLGDILRDESEEGKSTGSEVNLVLVDVASIQSFVKGSEKLQIVSASSYVVDLAVMFNALRYLQYNLLESDGVWYPVEGFLYSAGGNIQALVPDKLLDRTCEYLRRSFSEGLGDLGRLNVRIVHTKFSPNYRKMFDQLEERLLREKLFVKDIAGEPALLTGIEKVCDLCKRKPAEGERVKFGDEELDICRECRAKYRMYREFGHIRNKWEKARPDPGCEITVQEVFEGRKWGEVADMIMEIIAGHDSKPEGERLLNLAVVDVDGNLMGAFMSKAFSLSDALERSARIDLALKKAFRKAIESIRNGLKDVEGADPNKEISRALLGLQYIGGDDALLFLPSWAAIPFVVTMMIEFSREMGHFFDASGSGGATLSAGISVAPARQNIWLLLSASGELIDQAKKVGRFPCFDGALAFDVAERGVLSDKVIRTRMKFLHEKRLSTQPWVLCLSGAPNPNVDPFRSLRRSSSFSVKGFEGLTKKAKVGNILDFVEIVLGVKPNGRSDADLSRFYEEMFRAAYMSFRPPNREVPRAKLVRDLVRRAQMISESLGYSSEDRGFADLVRLVLVRDKAREDKEEKREVIHRVIEALATGEEATPLEDLNRLCKIVMGGAR